MTAAGVTLRADGAGPGEHRAGPGFPARVGAVFFRHRNALFPAMMVLVALVAHPSRPWGSVPADNLLDAIGLVVALAGQALRILTIGYRYIIRGGRDRKVYAERLVVDGVFAHCRNPMYTGNLLMFGGICLIANSTLLYAVGLPAMILVYRSIVAAEEDFLHRKFGAEFAGYCARVRRWAPDFRGLRRTTAGLRFNWRRVMVKEYGTFHALLLGAIFVRLWTGWRIDGRVAHRSLIAGAAAAGVVLASYIAARIYKKTHPTGDT